MSKKCDARWEYRAFHFILVDDYEVSRLPVQNTVCVS